MKTTHDTRLKRLIAAGLIVTLGAMSGACDGAGNAEPSVETATSELSRVMDLQLSDDHQEQLSDGNATFALDLYSEVASAGSGNVLVSPVSVSLALAMTYAGAKGETAEQMATALQFTLGQDDLHPALNWLDQELMSRGEGATGMDGEPFRLKIANSLWAEESYAFDLAFLDQLALNYGAGLQLLNFVGDPDGSRQTINTWVEDQTEDRIQDLLPEGSITSDTRLVLANAVYFNAKWALPFEASATYDGVFHTLAGDEVTTPLMRQTEHYRHMQGEDFSAIEMNYDGNEVSMLAIVPDAGSFDDVASRLDLAFVDEVLDGLSGTMVSLTMPSFEFEATVDVVEPLKAFGMLDAFKFGAADFSGMDGTRDLAITGIFHKTFVKLDESGTEAAAATAVVVGIESAAPMPSVNLQIDRPFIFAIRDNATGTILFIGRMADPTA